MMENDSHQQTGGRFNKKVSVSEALKARIEEVNNEIRAGKRKPKVGKFKYDTGEPVRHSWLRRLARGMTIGVIESVFKLIATVFRRVSDKLTGNTSQQDHDNATKTITALNEISDEENEKLQKLNRARQQLEAERHLQESRLREDKARAETNSLLDEGTMVPPNKGEDSKPESIRTSGLPHYKKDQAEDVLKKGLTSLGAGEGQEILSRLKEAYSEYQETKDLPLEERVEAIFKDIHFPKPEQDSRSAIIQTIHRIYCLYDKKLNGSEALEGANALTRVGVNQVMAYEAFISLTDGIRKSENPNLAMQALLTSIRDESEFDNELMLKTAGFMEKTKTQQEMLYRSAASPTNRKEDMNWAWLIHACEKATAMAAEATSGLNNALENSAAPTLMATQKLLLPAIDNDPCFQNTDTGDEQSTTTANNKKEGEEVGHSQANVDHSRHSFGQELGL